MPHPENVKTALEVEAVVRAAGAVPATIAVLNGRIQVGLSPEQLEALGRAGPRAAKCSRRDLAAVLASGRPGATTVAATMLAASMAGIRVFVTGGIGGVHRDGHVTMDVSADLTELGRTPVMVVCAGAKSLLDIGRTLEVLETQGVGVLGLRTDDFPAFFVPRSGHSCPLRVESPEEAARVLAAQLQLGLRSGLLLAVPIPEEHAAAAEPVERAIQQAVREAQEARVTGRDLTPFLLRRVNELTGGASLRANIHLIKNNARVGAEVALALAALLPRPTPPTPSARL
jgi:pseudouridine-5'-phosphate glycosidase